VTASLHENHPSFSTQTFMSFVMLTLPQVSSCGKENQSMNHILFHCANTSDQQETLMKRIGTWPASKQDLVNKYHKAFSVFVESTDFETLQRSDY
jgi:hypothetical protein